MPKGNKVYFAYLREFSFHKRQKKKKKAEVINYEAS